MIEERTQETGERRQERRLRPTSPSALFSETVVWQKAHAWVLDVYRVSRQFPNEEMFGLTSQLRRAAVSVPANFAEGFKRRTLPDKLRFFSIAQGSLEECRYYLILARDLGYADTQMASARLDEVSKLLAAYTGSVASKIGQRRTSGHRRTLE